MADARLGIPLNLFAGRPGTVVTTVPQVLRQRFGLSSDEAVARTVEVLQDLFEVEADAVVVDGDRVEVGLDADSSRIIHVNPDMAAVRLGAREIRESTPRVRLEGWELDWPTFSDEVGTDAAVWAVLATAGRKEPWVVGPSLATLTSRLDENPLACLRRAHAGLERRIGQVRIARTRGDTDRDGPPSGTRSTPSIADLTVALALTERAAHDAARAHRCRPLTLALQNLARIALDHLERTPVTWTPLSLSEAARRVLSDALDAAGVSAPVPY